MSDIPLCSLTYGEIGVALLANTHNHHLCVDTERYIEEQLREMTDRDGG